MPVFGGGAIAPFLSHVGYSGAMNADLEIDKKNIQSLIALWQDEEERLRSILEEPDTSSSVRQDLGERLASVRDQLQSLVDERDASEHAN